VAELPTGTLTFLFTDVEASTRLWEREPDAMRTALARHDEIIERVVEQYGGRVVRPRGEGDSRFAVFRSAVASVHAAARIQLALQGEPWPISEPLRVRMAIHTGEADMRDGDYYGAAPNRCARLRSLAHGGQVLISASTAGLLSDGLDRDISLRDLGVHRLRDLTGPERIYQLVHPELPSDFPSLRSVGVLPTNLPVQLTSFVGREPELAEVKRLLTATRLLTLTGAGGCGKTRLAYQASAELLDNYPDGIWSVELAPLAEGDLLPHAVAAATGIREESGHPIIETLASALHARELLLVLDNCEHLVTACAVLVDTLLHACPRLRVLTTSREPLGIAGETTWRVPPLRIADPNSMPTLETLTQYEAVRLFIERATDVQARFAVTNRNAPALAQVCYRLDGIPLAIELAAARISTLTVEEIARRLDDRFHLLTRGSRTALPRQQTLRALVDWSYDQLSLPEKALFRRLSVFAGGWTLEAAETICGIDPVCEREVLELLSALVDKSLVLSDEQPDGRTRYRLLETLREYGTERLHEADERSAFLQQHAEYLVREMEELDEVRKTDWQRWRYQAWPILEAEQDNVRAVLGRCRDRLVDVEGEQEIGLRLCSAMWWFNAIHANFGETWEWLNALLEVTPERVSRPRFLATWYVLVSAAGVARFAEGEAVIAKVRQLAASLQDDQFTAIAEGATGQLFLWAGRLEGAEEYNERGLTLARSHGPTYYLPIFMFNAGWSALRQGRVERAAELLDESISTAHKIGDDFQLSMALPLRGFVALLRNELPQAREYFQQSQLISENLPVNALNLGVIGLGQLALLEGDTAEALRSFGTALEFAARSGGRGILCDSLDGIAFVAAARGDTPRAVRLFAGVTSARESINQARAPSDQQRVDAALSALKDALGDSAFDAYWGKGLRLSLTDAVAEARQLQTV
jgi:predicted ATPase/class 3 adenylate cyclase